MLLERWLRERRFGVPERGVEAPAAIELVGPCHRVPRTGLPSGVGVLINTEQAVAALMGTIRLEVIPLVGTNPS